MSKLTSRLDVDNLVYISFSRNKLFIKDGPWKIGVKKNGQCIILIIFKLKNKLNLLS